MAKLNYFADAFTSDYKTYDAESGKTLAELFSFIDFDNSIIICNGRLVDKDYVVRDDDLVAVREFPSWNPFKSAAKKITKVVKKTVSGISNFIRHPINHLKSFVEWCGTGARYFIKKWLGFGDSDDSTENTNSTESATLPSINGAQNQSQKGKPFPVVIGKSLFTPMYIGKPYTTISGNDGETQFYYALFLLGYNDIEATNFKLDQIDIASNSDKISNGYINVDSASPKFKNGAAVLEIRDSEECELYNSKVVQENLGFELLNVENNPLIARRFSAAYPMKCEIEFDLTSLYNVANDSGAVRTQSVSVAIAYSVDGGSVWKPFSAIVQTGDTKIESSTIGISSDGESGNAIVCTLSAAKQKEIRLSASMSFSYEEVINAKNNVVQFRIWRTNAKPTDTRYVDAVILSSIKTWCFDRDKSLESGALVADVPIIESKRKITTRLAIKIKATDDLNDTLNNINCIVQQKCRIWNGEKWSTEKFASSNPAAVVLEIMTSNMLGKYKYDDSKLDLSSFGECYEFCERHTIIKNSNKVKAPFEVGGVLTREKKILDVINLVLSTCRSYLSMNGNLYSIVTDKPQNLAVTVLNNHNILAEGLSNSKSFEEIPDAYEVSFINEQLNYEEDTIMVYGDNVDRNRTDLNIEKLELTYITSPNLAWSIARYKLAKQKLRPESWVRKVGIDGLIINVGSLIELQDDTINVGIGDGAEIKELIYDADFKYIKGFIIDGGISILDASQSYGVKITQALGLDSNIKADKYREEELEISENGLFNTFYFKNPILNFGIIPSVRDICSFGLINSETTECICISKEDEGDGTWSLGLVPYQEDVYTADQKEVPEFNSKTTSSNLINGFSDIQNENVSINDLNNTVSELKSEIKNPVISPSVPVCSAKAEKDGIEFTCNPGGTDIFNTIAGYEVVLYKGSNASETSVVSADSQFLYEFDRVTDGYPEADTLSEWTFKARAVSVYGNRSEWTEAQSVNTDTYGTWSLEPPEIRVRISDRTITLICFEPERSDSREVYGNIRYKVQVKRPDIDTSYFMPASSLDPYGDESNYKDGDGYALSDGVYIQTMPLRGQSADNIVDTAYIFRVTAFSEANESSASETTATAVCTSIRDIVKASETAKEAYISSLSAISANLGVISKGSLDGSDTNYWALSTITDEQTGVKRYEGAFRVGGTDEYLKVTPVVNGRGEILKYTIEFKAGNFEVTTEATRLNGELIVQSSGDALDRTRISPDGTYYQHRDTVSSDWATVAGSNVNGVLTPQVFSEGSLVVSNQDMAARRKRGDDIGHPYLSDKTRVFHFDTDLFDQNGEEGVTVTDAETDGSHALVGTETKSGDIDFTPAILAVAPYSTIGKSLYGRFSLSASLGSTRTFTVDFWIQYIYAENQTLFEIGDGTDKVSLEVRAAECAYATGDDEASGIPYNEETTMSRLFRKIEKKAVTYFDMDAEMPYCDDGMEERAAKPYVEGGKYYVKSTADGTDSYILADVTRENYDSMVDAGLYERTIPYNEPDGAKIRLVHTGATSSETQEVEPFESNTWEHIGVVCEGDTIRVHLGSGSYTFTRYAEGEIALEVTLNKEGNSFMLDELMADTATAESAEDFAAHTADRIPWGALDKDKSHFIITAADAPSVRTNLFDSDIFREKVLGIIKEYHSGS